MSSSKKISQRGTHGIQSLIFLASFILSALLGLGSLSVSRAVSVQSKFVGSESLSNYYFSLEGFLTLVPLDLLLVAYACSIILVVFTLRILAEAQLLAEEDSDRARSLSERAEKYIEWALNALVFFVTLEFSSILAWMHIFFATDLWPVIAMCLSVALMARVIMRKKTNV